MKERIQAVLSRYFECDVKGNPNREYDSNFSAQNAIDAIVKIITEEENV